MALEAVTKALKKLTKDDDTSVGSEPQYFCVEDSFLSKDVCVSVEGVGDITFPIDENCIQKLIKVSSKAVFGKGDQTCLDTNIRDSQTIQANALKVNIKDKSLAAVLDRIKTGLNIENNCSLEPHLYNLLIYGPGQFFGKHRDSEKIKRMVATLVVVLPSHHHGGDLHIEHDGKKHVFFGSQAHEIVKCIAFYPDCRHEITKVTQGYRVALTFNIVLNSPDILQTVKVDKYLKKAVEDYFGVDHPTRLIFYMNHSYTKCSLKWSLLKGSDRTRGYALFVVAKHLGLKPCLALVEHQETYEVGADYYGDDELRETSITPYFWVSWNDREFKPHSGFDTGEFDESEICCTIETSDLLEPYSTYKEEEPYGNAPTTEDRSYRRACVVLFRVQDHSPKKRGDKEQCLPSQEKETMCNKRNETEISTIAPKEFYGNVGESGSSRQ